MSSQPASDFRRTLFTPAGRRRGRSVRNPSRAARARASAEARPGLAQPSATQITALLLWAWCWAGLFGLLLFEGLRGSHPLVGWLPFWLLLWPAASLGLMALRRIGI
ncbi:MAG: hypothetical protein MEQ07_06130 [Aquimonas sp.]|nr:hypothetical protein [Aquimonas sp.]